MTGELNRSRERENLELIYKIIIMRWFLLLLIYALLVSCQAKISSDNKKFASISDSLSAYEYKERGKLKSNDGDEQGAINDFSKAIELKRDYDTAYYNRGNGKLKLGDAKGAIKDYTKVISLKSGIEHLAYCARADAKDALGDWRDALVDYSKAIELNPRFIAPYVNRGVLKSEMGDYEGEIADYHLAIKHCEPSANLYNNLGRALYDLERFKESAEAYGEGIRYFPEDYRLYYGRGLARKRTGDKKGACADWMKSSELGCVEANLLLPLCEE